MCMKHHLHSRLHYLMTCPIFFSYERSFIDFVSYNKYYSSHLKKNCIYYIDINDRPITMLLVFVSINAIRVGITTLYFDL